MHLEKAEFAVIRPKCNIATAQNVILARLKRTGKWKAKVAST
jgi:hypothetical protein